jgi:integrase
MTGAASRHRCLGRLRRPRLELRLSVGSSTLSRGRPDLLRLRKADLKPDSIHINTSNTGTRLIIEWAPELRSAAAAAMSQTQQGSAWVSCTAKGNCYADEHGRATAFDSLWKRFISRALRETNLEERFQEKDLRKKTATDMPLDEAQRLLGHSTPGTTRRHYRLKGEIVRPHSLSETLALDRNVLGESTDPFSNSSEMNSELDN